MIVEGANRAATAAALEDAETFSVFHADFERLRAQFPAINQALITFLAGEVRILNERLLEAFYVPAERRVLRRLVELADLYAGSAAEVEIPAYRGSNRRARRHGPRHRQPHAQGRRGARHRRAPSRAGDRPGPRGPTARVR